MQGDRRDAILLWAVLSVVVQFAAPCFGAPLGVAIGMRALLMARRDLRAMDAGTMSAVRRAWVEGAQRVALLGIVLGSVLLSGATLLAMWGLLVAGLSVEQMLSPIAAFFAWIGEHIPTFTPPLI